MKILAADIGEKRIGLATCDELGVSATPYGHVERDNGLSRIVEIIEKESIERLVVGIPYLESGKLGSQAEDVWRFVEDLRLRVSIPIDFENEHLTSKEAEKRLKKDKSKKKSKKGDIDSMAAAIILESYLARMKE